MTVILGISHPMSWNPAACLLIDGELVAMVEEERLNRKKHAPHAPPVLSIDYCLKSAGLSIEDVDVIAVGYGRPWEAAWGQLLHGDLRLGWRLALRWLIELFRYERQIPFRKKQRLLFFNHHLTHAASAYFPSGFEDAMVMSIDGSGGSESGILGYAHGNSIDIFDRISNEASWGLLYEEITEICGFMRHSGEGKTMGLAPYSPVQTETFPFIKWDMPVPTIDYKAKKKYLSQFTPRKRHEPLTDTHRRLASMVQTSLERAGVQMVRTLHARTGSRKLVIAGGSALNCSMNGVLRQLDCIDDIFIQPAAHDAGTALGAALLAHIKLTGQRPSFQMKHAYWGPEYNNSEILEAITTAKVKNYKLCDDVCATTADLLVQGKIIGWFQGRAEIGPRALGNRSILANPSDPTMKDRVNIQVKKREAWRPFAPSILEEHVGEYLLYAHDSPFMIQAYQTRPEHFSTLSSAIHVDQSCRPQTVSQSTNPRYWELIEAFRQRTGVASLLNTSFNIDSQPIVCRPSEAIWTLNNSGLDAIVMGDYLVWKDGVL